MSNLEIGPEEKREKHVKTYVEPTVDAAIKQHQMQCGFYSVSEAVRDLIIRGYEAEY